MRCANGEYRPSRLNRRLRVESLVMRFWFVRSLTVAGRFGRLRGGLDGRGSVRAAVDVGGSVM